MRRDLALSAQPQPSPTAMAAKTEGERLVERKQAGAQWAGVQFLGSDGCTTSSLVAHLFTGWPVSDLTMFFADAEHDTQGVPDGPWSVLECF